MRCLCVLAVLATPALADIRSLEAAFRSPTDAALTKVLWYEVQVQLGVDVPACAKLKGATAPDKLVPCLQALVGRRAAVLDSNTGSSDPVLVTESGLAFALKLEDDNISAIGPIAPNANDRKLPTAFGVMPVDFHASNRLSYMLPVMPQTVVHKICADARGTITSRRLLTPSGVPALDKETTAYLATVKKIAPFAPLGTAIAVCHVVRIDATQGNVPVVVVGGMVGGDPEGVGSEPASPPPPPPPPPPPTNVAPTVLEGSRTAGNKLIAPDDATKIEIAKAQQTRVAGSYKLCIDVDGTVSAVSQLKATGYAAYDAKIMKTIRETWRYKPFQVDSHAAPVCTAVTFIYTQDLPKP